METRQLTAPLFREIVAGWGDDRLMDRYVLARESDDCYTIETEWMRLEILERMSPRSWDKKWWLDDVEWRF